MLELVEPDVVGVGGGVAVACDLAHLLDDTVEVRLEGAPVLCHLGAAPDVIGLGREACEGRLHLGRHVNETRAVALEDADLRCLRGREHGTCRGEALQQRPRLRGAEQGLVLLLQDRERLATVCGRHLGVDGRTVA